MPGTFPHRLLAVALILLMQGPATLVQEVAWVNMLVSYTQERGFTRGVIETFDGGHPCKLCKAAESLRQQGDDSRKPVVPQEIRSNLAWGPMMIPPGRLIAPVLTGRDIVILPAPWHMGAQGIDADGPATPPPERV